MPRVFVALGLSMAALLGLTTRAEACSCPDISTGPLWPEDGATGVPRNTLIFSYAREPLASLADGTPVALERVDGSRASNERFAYRPSRPLPGDVVVTITDGTVTQTFTTGLAIDEVAPAVTMVDVTMKRYTLDESSCEVTVSTCGISADHQPEVIVRATVDEPEVFTRVSVWQVGQEPMMESLRAHTSGSSHVFDGGVCGAFVAMRDADAVYCARVVVLDGAGNEAEPFETCMPSTLCAAPQGIFVDYETCEPFTGRMEPPSWCGIGADEGGCTLTPRRSRSGGSTLLLGLAAVSVLRLRGRRRRPTATIRG